MSSIMLAFGAGYLTAVAVLTVRARVRWARHVWRNRKQPRWMR